MVEQNHGFSLLLRRSRGEKCKGAGRIRRSVEGAVHSLVETLACFAKRALDRA
jgi:hypothetical protein